MLKAELRKDIRERKRQFTSQKLSELSLMLISKLLDNDKIKKAKTILMYYSMPDEVNTHQVVDTLVALGKKVLLPVVINGEELEIREYKDKKDLREGIAYHILEPVGRKYEDYKNIDVAVVPGMSFDANGNRLGRGKGYYDRFLKYIPQAYKIGICFNFQKVDIVPTEKTDIKMDEVID
ncbi:MAG: 5-formyltetrahydrofolate cyclo-ligase [Prevotella sp.]|nr:5-formyltetrahydrofolate cyclo-ligase [Prevotella sp.]